MELWRRGLVTRSERQIPVKLLAVTVRFEWDDYYQTEGKMMVFARLYTLHHFLSHFKGQI